MASGGHSSSRCAGLSLSRPLLLRSTGSRRPGSVAVAHGPSCSEACGIFPDQGSNPCLLHWQADSQPLRHQGSPQGRFLSEGVAGSNLWFRTTCLTVLNPNPVLSLQTLKEDRVNLLYCPRHYILSILLGQNDYSLLSVLPPVVLKPALHSLALSDKYLLHYTTRLSEGRNLAFINFEWWVPVLFYTWQNVFFTNNKKVPSSNN